MSAEDHSDCAVTSTTTCSPLHSPTPQAGRMEGVGGQQMPSWLTWPATTAGLATGEDRDSTATGKELFFLNCEIIISMGMKDKLVLKWYHSFQYQSHQKKRRRKGNY